MSQANQILGFILRASVAGLALAFVLVYLWPSLSERLSGEEVPLPVKPAVIASYADAVNRAAPAVVSIYTRSELAQPRDARRGGLYRLPRLLPGLASGVLMSEDGYILTNYHVIAQVTAINVALWDDRFIPAEVVGVDPDTDLAVLKINLDGLPVAPIADKTEVQVGDVVLAIGNALGLSHTVTMGIVSATGRNSLRTLRYEDYIQTDAAINSGNSGGALINAYGELIGISSRNLSSGLYENGPGAQNIGFAIPISLARNVMTQIIDYGSVRRGWLGLSLTEHIRPEIQSDGSMVRYGIGVMDVAKEGPAWVAGIRQGDIITHLGEESVTDASQFLLEISQLDPGSRVELKVRKGNETFETYATLIQRPPPQ